LAQQAHGVVNRGRLKQFERRHHIVYYGHVSFLLRSGFYFVASVT
jgi:hypothetical protein